MIYLKNNSNPFVKLKDGKYNVQVSNSSNDHAVIYSMEIVNNSKSSISSPPINCANVNSNTCFKMLIERRSELRAPRYYQDGNLGLLSCFGLFFTARDINSRIPTALLVHCTNKTYVRDRNLDFDGIKRVRIFQYTIIPPAYSPE